VYARRVSNRKPRYVEPGAVYHAMSRFVAREWFVESNVERDEYWSLFGAAVRESDWKCFASAIMSNHVHHGLVAGEMPPADLFGPVHRQFAQWLNQRRARIGQIFMRGPKLVPFYDDGVARLIGYIHENPVRAGLVTEPADTDWTTHRAYLGLDPVPDWLDIELGLRLAGFDDPEAFDDWCRAMRVTRSDLAAKERKRRRGRPPKRRNPPEQEAGFFRSGGTHRTFISLVLFEIMAFWQP
jgi:REP element-mobilizing transposase RayT